MCSENDYESKLMKSKALSKCRNYKTISTKSLEMVVDLFPSVWLKIATVPSIRQNGINAGIIHPKWFGMTYLHGRSLVSENRGFSKW